MEEPIRKAALENAVRYKGKAEINAVIGRIMAEKPGIKVKTIIDKVRKVVEEVNLLTPEAQKAELGEPRKKRKEKGKGIPKLQGARKGRVVVRFAPNPNGALSLGHVRQGLWNWFYAERYKGRYIIRMDDTDAKIKVPIREAYNWVTNDLNWLGVKASEIVVQSMRLDIYYGYAKRLIEAGKAYVCTCNVESWRNLVKKRRACPCRNLDVKEQLKKWQLMFNSYKEGDAVYRIKTSLNHPDPSVRDWPAFRIVDNPKHPLKIARVWPLLNFASAIDDHEFGVTHILRGIDLKISDDRQRFIYRCFKWKYPKTMYSGKLRMYGIRSTSETARLIKDGKLAGWDDPRLGTIMALRRRGFQPEAIANFIKDMGYGKADVNISFDNIIAYNKKFVEKGDRYFFVANPRVIAIRNAPNVEAKIPKHPDDEERGFRLFKTAGRFYIADRLEKGRMYRLMHLFNFKDGRFVSEGYEPKLNARLIHWLPVSKELVNVDVVMDDNTILKGFAEESIRNVDVDEVVQFERFGFCRLDRKEKNKLVFWFAHR